MLKVRDLRVEYSSSGVISKVLNGIDLDVAAGSVVGVVGESGSGKSTLALAILGLTRQGGEITAGSVEFEGRDLFSLDPESVRQVRGGGIAFIPQNPRGALNPVLRIGEQIIACHQAHAAKATEAESAKRAVELLSLVGINDPARRMKAFPHELSGGMAQRVLIAMALAGDPKLILADEPSSGLDVTIQAQVLDDMKQSVEAVGSGLVLITQDLSVVANYADRVYLMHAGEIVESAPVLEFFEGSVHPASIALLAAQRPEFDHAAVRLKGMPVDPRALPKGCLAHRRCPFAIEEAGCMAVHPELEGAGPEHLARCHRRHEIRDLARARQREAAAMAGGQNGD